MLIYKYEDKQRSKRGYMVCLVDVVRKLRSGMIMIVSKSRDRFLHLTTINCLKQQRSTRA